MWIYFILIYQIDLLKWNKFQKESTSSLMPLESLACESWKSVSFFTTEVRSDKSIVILVVLWVELSSSVILHLWMFFGETIWKLLSSKEPNTHDLKGSFFTKDGHSCEWIFWNMLGSAQETSHQVVANMELITFSLIDIIMEMPERPSVYAPIVHLIPSINGFSLLVWVIYEKSLEII